MFIEHKTVEYIIFLKIYLCYSKYYICPLCFSPLTPTTPTHSYQVPWRAGKTPLGIEVAFAVFAIVSGQERVEIYSDHLAPKVLHNLFKCTKTYTMIRFYPDPPLHTHQKKKIENIHNVFSHNNGIKLGIKIRRITGKSPNTLKLTRDF